MTRKQCEHQGCIIQHVSSLSYECQPSSHHHHGSMITHACVTVLPNMMQTLNSRHNTAFATQGRGARYIGSFHATARTQARTVTLRTHSKTHANNLPGSSVSRHKPVNGFWSADSVLLYLSHSMRGHSFKFNAKQCEHPDCIQQHVSSLCYQCQLSSHHLGSMITHACLNVLSSMMQTPNSRHNHMGVSD